MRIVINKVEVAQNLFAVNNGLNFGRFLTNNTKVYEIHLSKKELIKLIEKEYLKIKEEIKTDDELFNETSEFTNCNYGSLSELMKYEEDFEAAIKTYFQLILLNKIFDDSSEIKYVINSIDNINLSDTLIKIQGRVFKKV